MQTFFSIILTMFYMGYTAVRWSPYITPIVAKDQLFINLVKVCVFIGLCWVITGTVSLINKIVKNL